MRVTRAWISAPGNRRVDDGFGVRPTNGASLSGTFMAHVTTSVRAADNSARSARTRLCTKSPGHVASVIIRRTARIRE